MSTTHTWFTLTQGDSVDLSRNAPANQLLPLPGAPTSIRTIGCWIFPTPGSAVAQLGPAPLPTCVGMPLTHTAAAGDFEDSGYGVACASAARVAAGVATVVIGGDLTVVYRGLDSVANPRRGGA